MREKIETLMQLGLTLNQARAYYALIQLGSSTAKELAKRSHITRQDIYRVAPTLQEAGLIEKQIDSTKCYKAIPLEQGIKILLKTKAEEQQRLSKKTQELIKDSRNIYSEKTSPDTETEFTIFSGKGAITQKISKTLKKTRSNVDSIISQKKFSPLIFDLIEDYKKALEADIRIRLITEKPTGNAMQKILTHIQKNSSLQIAYLEDLPQTVTIIFDDTEAVITTNCTTPSTSALWSNNQSFISIVQTYFNTKWTSTKEIPSHISVC